MFWKTAPPKHPHRLEQHHNAATTTTTDPTNVRQRAIRTTLIIKSTRALHEDK